MMLFGLYGIQSLEEIKSRKQNNIKDILFVLKNKLMLYFIYSFKLFEW